MATMKSLLMALSLMMLVGQPALCLDCLIPTNWLSSCATYLKKGDPQYLTTPDPTPIFGSALPTCCDKLVDMKQTYYECPTQFDRQNMCACIRQECRKEKYYNFSRMQEMPGLCGIAPISDTLVLSRTSPCELLQ